MAGALPLGAASGATGPYEVVSAIVSAAGKGSRNVQGLEAPSPAQIVYVRLCDTSTKDAVGTRMD